jgi:hypothetical protein
MSDADLLAACQMAGPPGSKSHREALRAYWRSVFEWQQRDAEWRREEAAQVVDAVLGDVARVVFCASMLRRAGAS